MKATRNLSLLVSCEKKECIFIFTAAMGGYVGTSPVSLEFGLRRRSKLSSGNIELVLFRHLRWYVHRVGDLYVVGALA